MKLKGHTFDKPNVEYVVIPRTDEDVVFHCGAVLSYDEFDSLCSLPKAPEIIKKGGIKEANTNDPTYLTQVEQYSENRVHWIVLQSLKSTPGLIWDTVKPNDYKTWKNYDTELKEANFTDIEIQKIQEGCFAANCLSESRLEEARENFQRILAEESKS